MKNICVILLFASCFTLHALKSLAKPVEGFLEGPYITLQAGIAQIDQDKDQESGEKVGRDIEPSFGFFFGWNITDELAADFSARYSTNTKNTGREEHIVLPDIAVKYSPYALGIFNDSAFIIPYIRGGMGFRISILPSNDLASDKKRTQFAVGPTVGAGVDFLITKYLFAGIFARYDIYNYDEVRQDLDLATPPLNNVLIYKGGWQPSFGAGINIGVHY